MSNITITRPDQDELKVLNIGSWSPWSCEPSTFEWTYSARETAYVFEGRVIVKTDNEEIEIKAGDMVVFPKGLSCTWKVLERINKVYKFD